MKAINKDITQATTLPGYFYKSNDSFNLSKENIFAKTWQIVGDNSNLKLANSAHPFKFMSGFIDEPLVLINDNKNNINCFSNVGSKWIKTKIVLVNNILNIDFADKFIERRGRINCSLKDKDSSWRWLGIQFVVGEK